MSMVPPYLLDLLVATGIGLIIGLEREFKETLEKDHFAGIRTYPLVSILGFVVIVVGQHLTVYAFLSAFPAVVVLIGIAYYSRTTKGHTGLSSELALIVTFLLGCLCGLDQIREALAVTVITTALLSLKGQFKAIITRLTQDEIFAFLKFIILGLLVLPFLPDQNMGPNGLLNPSDVGLIVVIISSLSFAGYLLVKFVGSEKGILLIALFGGIFSSTSVAWVFSSRSKGADDRHEILYAGGVILASSLMFLRVAIVTLIFDINLFKLLVVPCGLMMLAGGISAWLMLRKKQPIKEDSKLELGNPLDILNALLFGVLFTGISFLIYYADLYFGDRGLIISGIISGLMDVDAITISMARYATVGKLSTAVAVIVAALLTNTLFKYGIVFFNGSAQLKKKTAYAFGSMVMVGLLYSMWIYSKYN